jgi:hypothetical protein
MNPSHATATTRIGAPGCGAGLLDVDAATALAAAQPKCTPGCTGELLCSPNGACVSPSSIAPGALDQGNVVHGGCAFAATADAGAPILVVAVAWLGFIRYKRAQCRRSRSSASRSS